MAQLALVVEDSRQRRWLENQLVKASHHVALSCDVAALENAFAEQPEPPETWLVLASPAQAEHALDFISRTSSAAILVLDDWPDEVEALAGWFARVQRKLNEVMLPMLSRDASIPVDRVWVLGASLGGPEAVMEFIGALPAGLPVAFVYVQHIEEAFDQALSTYLNRNSYYKPVMFSSGVRIAPGQILIIAPEVKPRFLPFDRVIPSTNNWQGRYRPCIDEVAGAMAQLYRERLGLIIFSGTCNDGEQACRQVASYGGDVWAQSPETCVCSTMPEAALSTGVVTAVGSPAQLAGLLAQRRHSGFQRRT